MRTHVPEDVIHQILLNLPVKSLLRFMSVCSSWQSFIKSPSFVSNHLTRTNRGDKDCQQQQLLLVGCWVDRECGPYSERQYSLLVDGEEFKEYRKLLNLRFQTSCRMVPQLVSKAVGSCNGLVCLKGKDDDSYHLWNPTIQKLFTVPKSNLINKFRAFKDKNDDAYRFNMRTLEGFGFDSSTNDYKVLRIVQVFASDRNGDHISWDGWFDIYSYNAGSWRDITPADGLHFSRIITSDNFQSQVPFANGFLYCLGIDDERFYGLMIWQFDMAIEVFREIVLPEELVRHILFDSLIAYGDSSIALFERSFSDDQRIARLYLWHLQENDGAESWSWTKVPVIEEDEGFNLKVMPLLVRKNGEPVMEKSCRGVFSYDPRRKQCHFLCKEGYNASVNYYVESLALLDIENEATEAMFKIAFVNRFEEQNRKRPRMV